MRIWPASRPGTAAPTSEQAVNVETLSRVVARNQEHLSRRLKALASLEALDRRPSRFDIAPHPGTDTHKKTSRFSMPEKREVAQPCPGISFPRINFKRKRPLLAGGVLLSHGLHRSTIGARGLNFRVRDGTGCASPAMAAGQQGAFSSPLGSAAVPSGPHSARKLPLQRTRPRACPPRAGEGGTSKSSDD